MIYFDNRAGSKEFPAIPPLSTRSTETFNFSADMIPGDCYFEGNGPTDKINIGTEIKSLYDLLGSLDTARLQGQGIGESHGQLLRMLDYFDITNLVYYGNYWASEDDKSPLIHYFTSTGNDLIERIVARCRYEINSYAKSDITKHSRHQYILTSLTRWIRALSKALSLGPRRCYWHGLHAALSELQYLGVHVHRVNTKREVAILISSLYNLYAKPWHKHKLLRAFNTSASTKSRIASIDTIPHDIKVCAKILSGFSQLGYERALAISYHYSGDIAQVFASIARDENALANIQVGKRAIGPVISHAVHAIGKLKQIPNIEYIAKRLKK